MSLSIEIDLGDVRYPVHIGSGVLDGLEKHLSELVQANGYYFIIDEYIYRNYQRELQGCLDALGSNYFVVSGGKSNKTFNVVMQVFSDLDSKNVSRDVALVAIGGGVVGDLAGFVSSCWYRGVKLVHIPTTLLSAVDSCLGGKTAINFKHTVNAVGTYHHPECILIDTNLLLNLPAREVSSGFGEIIKYSALGAAEITVCLESYSNLTNDNLAKYVALSLQEKERFVRGDVHESANRLFLNFGHTIGHAIEFSTVYNGAELLRHGEGVALGMVAIFRISIELGYLEEDDLVRMKGMLEHYGLPAQFKASQMSVSKRVLREKVLALTFKDKKRTNEYLRLVVLNGWGKPEIYKTADRNLIMAGIEEVVV